MEKKVREIIEVNGVKYDAITGQRIEGQATKNEKANYLSEDIHSNLQRSSTLNRKFVKRPEDLSASQRQAIEQFKNRHNYAEIRRSAVLRSGKNSHAQISKFEGVRGSASRVISPISHTEKTQQIQYKNEEIAPAEIHPIQKQAIEKMREQKIEKTLPTPKEIKDSAIVEALEKSREVSKKQRGIRKQSWMSRRMASFLACCLVLAIGLGYLTYLSAPQLSVRIAAIQSGIDASSPQYAAAGYSMRGIARFDGKSVNLTYSNGSNSYVLKQAQSSWDSVALLENYVEKKWDKDYLTYQEKGLTIYKGRNEAAVWVNNGKIYTLEGDTALSNEDIRKIATSLQ
jgi:hypothetical protein